MRKEDLTRKVLPFLGTFVFWTVFNNMVWLFLTAFSSSHRSVEADAKVGIPAATSLALVISFAMLALSKAEPPQGQD